MLTVYVQPQVGTQSLYMPETTVFRPGFQTAIFFYGVYPNDLMTLLAASLLR